MQNPMKSLWFSVLFPILLISLLNRHGWVASSTNSGDCSSVHVGVILDLGTTTGRSIQTSISMAIDDFNKLHDNFSSKVILHFRNSSGGVLGATSTGMSTNFSAAHIYAI